MEYYEIFPGVGERVDRLRLHAGETVAALAKAIGVSPSYTSRLLKDKKAWGIEQIRDAAKHYKVSTEYICTGMITICDKQADGVISYETAFGNAIVQLEKLPEEERNRAGLWAMKRIIDVIQK